MKEFKHQELEEATCNYSKSYLIGKGSHGSIYKATLRSGQVVAIKTPSLGLCKVQNTSKVENEARILSSISPNQLIVNLLGISHDSTGHTVLVMEHMPGGMLHDLLHLSTIGSPLPSWRKRAKMAVQIARAVQFLHESKPLIIHRDIKSENILFDSKSRARLADFGLSVCINSFDPTSLPAGTIGYLDPSYTTPCKLSTKNDVFSFGVLLLEIISGTKAIDVSRTPASLVEWSRGLIEQNKIRKICDKRVNMPQHMEGVILNMLVLAIQCVSSDEESRPSMTEVVTKMESFRYPIWVDMVQSLVQLRSRKSPKTLSTSTITVVATTSGDHVGIAKKKLLLREILAGDDVLLH
ncbi:serine/threonine-protein kinase-like protein [Tanacetum coccineum]|uniref:Serine/threonine-protein kinase-like protein n=1 Tax=Tanacetum coccineum TaxID=301880 RepID=A0ABQ5BIF1_9ASTR